MKKDTELPFITYHQLKLLIIYMQLEYIRQLFNIPFISPS
jgi:hypothetical protein